jgi:hypothetical protein
MLLIILRQFAERKFRRASSLGESSRVSITPEFLPSLRLDPVRASDFSPIGRFLKLRDWNGRSESATSGCKLPSTRNSQVFVLPLTHSFPLHSPRSTSYPTSPVHRVRINDWTRYLSDCRSRRVSPVSRQFKGGWWTCEAAFRYKG